MAHGDRRQLRLRGRRPPHATCHHGNHRNWIPWYLPTMNGARRRKRAIALIASLAVVAIGGAACGGGAAVEQVSQPVSSATGDAATVPAAHDVVSPSSDPRADAGPVAPPDGELLTGGPEAPSTCGPPPEPARALDGALGLAEAQALPNGRIIRMVAFVAMLEQPCPPCPPMMQCEACEPPYLLVGDQPPDSTSAMATAWVDRSWVPFGEPSPAGGSLEVGRRVVFCGSWAPDYGAGVSRVFHAEQATVVVGTSASGG
jgi:hypothetical protein